MTNKQTQTHILLYIYTSRNAALWAAFSASSCGKLFWAFGLFLRLFKISFTQGAMVTDLLTINQI